ncbi:MAG: helix-turn-helix domain-containing protein [Spirosomataceae bacterium]
MNQGKLLKELIKIKGFSNKKLASLLGVGSSSLSEVFKMELVSHKTISKYAKAMDISVSEIYEFINKNSLGNSATLQKIIEEKDNRIRLQERIIGLLENNLRDKDALIHLLQTQLLDCQTKNKIEPPIHNFSPLK